MGIIVLKKKEQVNRLQSFISKEIDGVHVHILPTEKFKVTTIQAVFHTELAEGTATAQSMLPHVLLRGSENHPTSESIQLALSDLYGATFVGGASKKGERQLVEFLFRVVNEKYLKSGEQVLEKGLSLMAEVLLRPQLENGGFRSDFVEKEKEQHIKRIDSILDDKIVYAAERCLEEMTKGERFAIPKFGRKSDLEHITGKTLFDTYQALLRTAPLHLYIVGNVDPEKITSLIGQYMKMDRAPKEDLRPTETHIVPDQVKEVVDRLDVNQGKLNIGLRTEVTHADNEYPALVVYNGILGGFPHSKLFVNVREKASLAYYVSSRLESYKGLLYIQSGIEIDSYDKAVNIIKQQLEEMKQGNISDTELEYTKSGLINGFKTVQDSPEGIIDVHSGGFVSGKYRSMDELIEQVSRVTKDEVQHVANRVLLDTVYFLRDKKGAVANA